MAPHSSTLLPGESHGWRSLVGYSPWGLYELDMTEQLHFHISLSCIGEGNGNPLQCSCLENPRDGGARWAAVYGVTQSWTRLKWLSSSSRSLIVLFSPVYSKKLSYFHISIAACLLCFITINSSGVLSLIWGLNRSSAQLNFCCYLYHQLLFC